MGGLFTTTLRRLGSPVLAAACLAACGPDEETSDQVASSNTAGSNDGASAGASAPVESNPREPAEVDNARDAQREAAARREATPADLATGQRGAAEIEQITWDYGPCTDAASLLPPPPEGWGLLNDTPLGEWPIDADRARINYTYSDASLEPGTAEYAATLENMSINISSGTATTDALATALSEPFLREAQFEPGPYNYPVMRYARAVLLGPYYVQLDGTGAELDEMFATIIRCGIEGGLIAEGVDPATLTVSPPQSP